ncbi:hypothetical protein KXD93_02335 [Mucilaginibacter sp. BJC16-A38]|uniref:hypothetical protein n=1 Tax=Mucilaginibacter phenanthrenivorans TaxID=1234842 RepID=UPI00215783EA|nr:hypothetical protein [Mucilaginibacter phenanthrenivorans]MCR8556459.1 hypothetical protein [Mucilaginibacter phenanthrenivorans]
MKKILALTTTAVAAVLCFSFTAHSDVVVVPKAAKIHKAKVAIRNPYVTFPTGVAWNISYDAGNYMVALDWPLVDNPYLAGIPFTFEGNTQVVDPHKTSYILWVGSTYALIPYQSYTINIGGVNYYFYMPGSGSGKCIITGHS